MSFMKTISSKSWTQIVVLMLSLCSSGGGGIMLLPSVPLHGRIRRATVGQANSSFQVDILAS